MSLNKLEYLYIALQDRKMELAFQFELTKPSLHYMVDNKELALTAATVH